MADIATQVDRSWGAAVPVRVALAALGFRLVSVLLALLVNVTFPLNHPEQLTVFGRTSPFWDTFARFDSGFYQGIAWSGYAPISWVCFVLAMVALYYLARLDLPRDRAERAVLLTMIFPFAFFFGVVYSESTFLLFVVLAFYSFRTRHWMLGGLCGAVATATRVPGILMMPALAWLARQNAQPTRRDRLGATAGLILAASGFVSYCAYIYHLTGNPFEWASTLERWGYFPGGAPWTAPVNLVRQLVTHPIAISPPIRRRRTTRCTA